jgi:hypothetical protein
MRYFEALLLVIRTNNKGGIRPRLAGQMSSQRYLLFKVVAVAISYDSSCS